MRKQVVLLTIFFLISNLFAQSNIDSLVFAYKQKTKYFDKSGSLNQFYAIDKTGIKVYSSAGEKVKNNAEWEASWSEVANVEQLFKQYPFDTLMKNFKTLKNGKSKVPNLKVKGLMGKKIAIDPGHTAGDFNMAQTESRYLKVVTDTQTYQLSEGIMAFKVAQLLRKKLEQQGAQVYFTRDSSGFTAFNEPYMKWYNNYKAKKGSAPAPKKLFIDYFRDYELTKRAEKINNYKPDIAVIIHFNVNEKNEGWSKTTSKNFNMTFVSGNFTASNLTTAKARFDFFRLLVTHDWENSVKLSSYCVQEFKTQLNVPIAKTSDAEYLQDKSIATYKEGVFSRNLYLTRAVRVPLVYGETLYQDNHDEIKRLFFEQDKRLQQVAEAYYQGILNYFSE